MEPLIYSSSSSNTLTFEEACYSAAEADRSLELQCDVTLNETIVLRKRQKLVIYSQLEEKKKEISGDLHSLFLLNNHSSLTLQRINLNHSLETNNHKNVGAAVNLRYKSSLSISSGFIKSKCGFCCWAVQKTTVKLDKCQLTAPLRSPLVFFGQPNCILAQTTISNAGVHAICARGDCQISMEHCQITNSAARAVYAYANASITMKHCTITHTKRPDKAAIEVSAATGDKSSSKDSGGGGGGGGQQPKTTSSSSLILQDCEITDNQGIGVLIRGAVRCDVLENVRCERNQGGDLVYTESLVQENDTTNAAGGAAPMIQRDASGSSFRQGDWWCPNVHHHDTPTRRIVVIGGNKSCPTCTEALFQKEFLLSITEINQLNQGIMPAQWQYDSDEQGWQPYDSNSNRLLEQFFQQQQDSPQNNDKNNMVLLQDGKYQVNLDRMEQINVESQMLRLVRRI